MKSGQLVRSQFCALRAVCWRAILLEDESGGQQAIAQTENTLKEQ